jgi:hypothetical protein
MALPQTVLNYLFERAANAVALQRGLSRLQQQRVIEAFHQRGAPAQTSDAMRAMRRDIELFGEARVFGRDAD